MANWQIDLAHSNAEFSVRHMMVTTVRGSIAITGGTFEFDQENPANSRIEVTLDPATINTGVNDRDNHLRSADFFAVETYPEITFKSTNVEVTGENTGKITGDMTMHGVTKSVVLDVEFLGTNTNPMSGAKTAGFEGSVKVNREDFGLTWNVALEQGGVLVSKDVKIAIGLQAFVPVAETA